jgi:hypothetical protein
MGWKRFFRDQARDAFGLSAERDAINDLTEGHPAIRASFTGLHKRDYAPIHSAYEPKGKKQKTMAYGDGHWRPMTVDAHGGPAKSSRTHRSKYHTTLGHKPNRRCNKSREQQTVTDNTIDDKNLHTYALMQLPYDADNADMNRRHANLAYVKGVALRWCFKLKQGFDLLEPLSVRWAILCPETNTGSPTDISVTEFWRDRETDDDMYEDFATVGKFNDYMCRQINTDKYGIIKTGQFTLSPSTTGTSTVKHWASTKIMKMWIPIRRKMTWADTVTDFPEANVYLVFWYCNRGDLTNTQKYPSTGTTPVETQIEHITYFKNVFQ